MPRVLGYKEGTATPFGIISCCVENGVVRNSALAACVIDTFRISPLGGLPRQPSISFRISHHLERAERLLGVQKHPSELSTASRALSIPREKQRGVGYWRVQSAFCLGLDLTIWLSEGLQGQDVLLGKWGKTKEL